MIPMRTLVSGVAAVPLLLACGGGGAPAPDDPTVPVATLTAPAALARNLNGTITLTATASDDVGVTAVEFQVDGVTVASDGTSPYGTTVDTAPYASGQHVVRVRAADAAGNVSSWSSATVEFGGNRTLPAGFAQQTWITGLNHATAFAQAPDGRFFVTEQGGAVRIVKNDVLLATPFQTLPVDASGERGLLGVALHPNFANNRHVYLYYTTTEGGTHNRISRFTAGTGASVTRTTSLERPLAPAHPPVFSVRYR